MTTNLPSDQEWVSGLFREMLATKTPEGRREFIIRHPVLFSRDALALLVDEFTHERRVLAQLDRWRQRFWEHPEEYPRGSGPLDDLIDGLRTRRLTLAGARAQAIELRRAGLLSNTYVKVAMEPLLREVWRGTAFAAEAAELILDSAWAMPFEQLARHVRLGAARGFILVVHATLTKAPNGRLLARAHEAGRWALSTLDWSTNPSGRASLLHELGVMDLDAYASRWSAGPDYSTEIAAWLARATSPMPTAAEGLARARANLHEAVGLRDEGAERGLTLKALLQATVFEAAASQEEPDKAAVRTLGTEALRYLASDEPDARAWVASVMKVLDLV